MRRILFFLFLIFLTLPFSAYAVMPIKILLVPGHSKEVWGAQYGNTKEADMNLALGNKLFDLLNKDKRFEVKITRDKNGFKKEFADYFKNEREDIINFTKDAKNKFKDRIASGDFIKKVGVHYNSVNQEIAVVLYGINKWVNENKMDAAIHIHFNDYPRKNKWKIGKYNGFAVYMPDVQMNNSIESHKLAKDIFDKLITKYKPSNYLKENGGLVSAQNLIALGSNDTLLPSTRSVLIEYGYIYEKIFRNNKTRHQAYKDMASLTAKGIKEYFFPKKYLE